MTNIKSELIKVTSDLIRFNTVQQNPKEIRKCIDYIKKYFNGKPFIIKEYVSNGKPNLVISYENKKNFKLILNGHIDVVDADANQFSPHIKDGKIFGRGAIDMKSGVAALMVLMKEFGKSNINLKNKNNKSKTNNKFPDMALMIVSDEEIGGFDGTGYIMKQGYKSDLAIAAEPNQEETGKGLDMTVTHKGVLWVKIITKGKACHASRPWHGKNALDILVQKYLEIRKIFPEAAYKTDKWANTLNLGKIIGGDSVNRLPDHAEMYLDIRLNETTSTKDALAKLKKIKDITIEVLDDAPMLVNKDMTEIIKFRDIAQKFLKMNVKMRKEHGASDMRFFSDLKMPAIIFGPSGQNYHGIDEFAIISSLEKYYQVMHEYIDKRLCN